jgi:zinc protease
MFSSARALLAKALAGLLMASLTLVSLASAQSADDWSPQTFTLSNGMRAVVLPDHRAPVVTHMVWYRVGSADEVPGKSGIAHFLEHLMFKATSTRAAGEYSRTVARNGGQDNAGTSFDFTNYHFRIAKDRLPQMMRMEADRMVNLQLADDEVTPERNVVLEERRQRVGGNPAATLDEMIWEKLYPGHPYSIPVIGYDKEIAALSSADATEWYHQWYGPENAILVVAGDITAAELEPLAKEIYGGIPRRGDLKQRNWPEVKPLARSVEVKHSDPKVRQAEWKRNWIGVPLGHPDAAALQVGVQILGGGRTSRLYRELVEGGDAVMVYAWSNELEAAGPVGVSVQPAQGVSMDAAKAEAMAVVREFIAEGPTEEELTRAKKIIAADGIFRRDNQVEMANWYGIQLTAGLTLEQIAAQDARIAAVSAADVRAVMKKYLSGTNHVDALLLPVAR